MILCPAWTVSGALSERTRPKAEVASAEEIRRDLIATIAIVVVCC